jgi:hypothetical protein
VSIPLRKVGHYRYLTNEFLRLAANDSFIESQNYYLQMAEHYGTLAEEQRKNPDSFPNDPENRIIRRVDAGSLRRAI